MEHHVRLRMTNRVTGQQLQHSTIYKISVMLQQLVFATRNFRVNAVILLSLFVLINITEYWTTFVTFRYLSNYPKIITLYEFLPLSLQQDLVKL